VNVKHNYKQKKGKNKNKTEHHGQTE